MKKVLKFAHKCCSQTLQLLLFYIDKAEKAIFMAYLVSLLNRHDNDIILKQGPRPAFAILPKLLHQDQAKNIKQIPNQLISEG